MNLLDEPGLAAYFAAIDAIGAEDTLFFGPRENNNGFRPQRRVIENLAAFQAAGKPVLSVDYVIRKRKVRRYYPEARLQG